MRFVTFVTCVCSTHRAGKRVGTNGQLEVNQIYQSCHACAASHSLCHFPSLPIFFLRWLLLTFPSTGLTQEANRPISRPKIYVDLTKSSTRGESTDTLSTTPATDAIAGMKRLPEETLLQQMAELNRPASAGSRRRESRAYTASSSTSASTFASASASPSVEPLPSDQGDPMDTEDGESSRTGLQTNVDNVSYYTYIGK